MLKNYLTILSIQQTQFILMNAFKYTSLLCKPQNCSSDNGLTALLPPPPSSKRLKFKHNVIQLDIDEWLSIVMADECVINVAAVNQPTHCLEFLSPTII